jgi:hypothetical protein
MSNNPRTNPRTLSKSIQRPVAPPNLPVAPKNYTQTEEELFRAVLRLFFTSVSTYIANDINEESAPPYKVANLPSATANATTRVFVSDSLVGPVGNFGAVVNGGGSNLVPAYSDGFNWRIG